MRIAQVAPLIESVPPKLYGGTERVVSNLAEELVRQHHDVTLFASGDSRTSARLVPEAPRALRLSGSVDTVAPHVVMLEHVLKRADEFDIVHFHVAPLHFLLARRCLPAHVTTLHGRLDLPELGPLYREFSDIPCVSISDAQRLPLQHANWVATVPHGLPRDLFAFQPRPGSYFAFLGRISPEKRVDRAIAIARGCGQPIRIAAKVDPADTDYFEREIRPLLDDPLVEFVGEIGDADKGAFLGGAKALLFPIDWPEPFGLVMIEALACGTPVVAFRGGSVPEVIDEGRTGFIVDNVRDAIEAVRCVERLDRRFCRTTFERRFTVERMARKYVEVYERLINREEAFPGITQPSCSTSYA
jgi:glycosyltransferase involved in cell wall biosynthesis